MSSIKAQAIVHEIVWKQPCLINIKKLCSANNIDLEPIFIDGPDINNSARRQADISSQCKNAIVWGLHFLPYGFFKQNNNNILFLENSVLKRNRQLYVDSEGFGNESSYVFTGQNKEQISSDERKYLHQILDEENIPFFHGGNPDGPILVTLQSSYSDLIVLDACSLIIPTELPLLIRLHPVEKMQHCQEKLQKLLSERKNCSLETNIKNSNIVEKLKTVSCHITYNSAAAFFSSAMGIKTATLGRGLFSGAFATLECDKNPFLIKSLSSFKNDPTTVENLLFCIHKREIPITSNYDIIFENISIQNWIRRMQK